MSRLLVSVAWLGGLMLAACSAEAPTADRPSTDPVSEPDPGNLPFGEPQRFSIFFVAFDRCAGESVRVAGEIKLDTLLGLIGGRLFLMVRSFRSVVANGRGITTGLRYELEQVDNALHALRVVAGLAERDLGFRVRVTAPGIAEHFLTIDGRFTFSDQLGMAYTLSGAEFSCP